MQQMTSVEVGCNYSPRPPARYDVRRASCRLGATLTYLRYDIVVHASHLSKPYIFHCTLPYCHAVWSVRGRSRRGR